MQVQLCICAFPGKRKQFGPSLQGLKRYGYVSSETYFFL